MAKNKTLPQMTADDLMEEIELQAEAGVDFITVHCGITRQSLSALKGCKRIMGMVSRGGSFIAEWITANKKENPLFSQYDRLLEICRQHDVTLSLGDGLRPGAIHDAEDRAQISELLILGELTRRARKAGVQVMIEGPGHVPLGRIAGDVQLQKRLCDNAPYYVLGPLPTDIAPGYDHLVGAIGGAVAAASGVDFLCYLTPAEHLHLPTVQDVHDGVIATRIAAHIGDLEKGLPGSEDWDRRMSLARREFDWETMYNQAIDPELARKRRMQSEDHDREVCTMCGDFCAIKTFDRIML
jgi:phosphomethylpyrimidine synthase